MNTSAFNIADYLNDQEMIVAYLNQVLEEGDEQDLIIAIGHVAKATGMTKIAEETGMSRSSLYKALTEDTKPRFETMVKVLRAIGGEIQIIPAQKAAPH